MLHPFVLKRISLHLLAGLIRIGFVEKRNCIIFGALAARAKNGYLRNEKAAMRKQKKRLRLIFHST